MFDKPFYATQTNVVTIGTDDTDKFNSNQGGWHCTAPEAYSLSRKIWSDLLF